PSAAALFGSVAKGAHVEALALRFDQTGWIERFLASWPERSPAHASYFRRISHGPRFTREQGEPRRLAVA
ncbi:MAG: hypothetical protein ACM3X5_07580, partial [Bacillota bacterium]